MTDESEATLNAFRVASFFDVEKSSKYGNVKCAIFAYRLHKLSAELIYYVLEGDMPSSSLAQ